MFTTCRQSYGRQLRAFAEESGGGCSLQGCGADRRRLKGESRQAAAPDRPARCVECAGVACDALAAAFGCDPDAAGAAPATGKARCQTAGTVLAPSTFRKHGMLPAACTNRGSRYRLCEVPECWSRPMVVEAEPMCKQKGSPLASSRSQAHTVGLWRRGGGVWLLVSALLVFSQTILQLRLCHVPAQAWRGYEP